MALISGYGDEKMPDSVWVSLKFDPNDKFVREIMVSPKGLPDQPIYPVDGNLHAYKDLRWKNRFYERSVHKCGPALLANTACSIREDEQAFVYMDVGRWGGNTDKKMDCVASENQQRDFGVICGYHAVLCRFDSKKPGLLINTYTKIPDKDLYVEKILKFLQIICSKKYGVKIIKWESIFPNRFQKENEVTVNVFLGDLHLPLYLREPELKYNPGNKNLMDEDGWYYYNDLFMGKVTGPLYREKVDALNRVMNKSELRNWYKDYFKGDIFRGAEDDLEIFLKNIGDAANTKMNIRFFQLGDMYDLWIGLDIYYELFDGPSGEVKLLEEGEPRNDKKAREFIKYYVERTNACFPSLIKQFRSLNVKEKIILYGNHDCYLAVYNPEGKALKRYYKEESSNLYCEHGQWIDSFNYDGNKKFGISPGHRITELVYAWPIVRKADPDRRYSYIAGASLEYYKNSDFSFFVMGHTHLPYLTKVSIGRMFY